MTVKHPVRPKPPRSCLSPTRSATAKLRAARTTSSRAARTPTPRATTSIPVGAPGFIVARPRLPRLGRGRTRVHRVRDGTALGHARPRLPARRRGGGARRCGTARTSRAPLRSRSRCAETLLDVVPGDMVKFAKNGSDVTTAAVKLARAATGRDLVAICGDQPFFSTDDWFIGTTPMAAGIPKSVGALTLSFRYNDLESVEALFRRYPDADRVPRPRAGGRAGARCRVPRGPAPRLCDARRRAPRLRRDDHRVPLAPRRRADALRRAAGPLDLRQGHGQRLLRLGPRRAARRHGARRSAPRRGPRLPALDDARRARPTRWRRRSRRCASTSRRASSRRSTGRASACKAGHRGGGAGPRRRRPLRGRRAGPATSSTPPATPTGIRRRPSGRSCSRRRSSAASSCRRWSSATPTRTPTSTAPSRRCVAPSAVYRRALDGGVERFLEGRPVQPVFRTRN